MSVSTEESSMQSKTCTCLWQLAHGVFTCKQTHTRSPYIADSDASGEYFDYSIDELGLQDIRAADRVISNVVCNELVSS